MVAGIFSTSVLYLNSASRSPFSASLRFVTSRVIASRPEAPPPASRSGTAWVSSQRRVPLSPTSSNSSVPDPPRSTFSVRATKASLCPGAM